LIRHIVAKISPAPLCQKGEIPPFYKGRIACPPAGRGGFGLRRPHYYGLINNFDTGMLVYVLFILEFIVWEFIVFHFRFFLMPAFTLMSLARMKDGKLLELIFAQQ